MARCPDKVRRGDFETWDDDGDSTTMGDLGAGWILSRDQPTGGSIYKSAGTGEDGGNTLRMNRFAPSGNMLLRARFRINAAAFVGKVYTARVRFREINFIGTGSRYAELLIGDGYSSGSDKKSTSTDWWTLATAIIVNAKATIITINVQAFSDSNNSDHTVEFDDLVAPEGRAVARTLTQTTTRTPVAATPARTLTPYSPY